ncbi:MAG: endonuclease/exonuclease/phosphatase family protein [Spirochaetaceae bacterium]
MNISSFALRLCCIGAVLVSPAGCARWLSPDDGVTVVSYNLQNLFDGVSQGTEYPAFDPETGSYGPEDYHRRLETLGGLLSEAFPVPPSILVLQEVENRGVAGDLLDAAGWTHAYEHLLFDPAPVGSVGVAVASVLPVVGVRSHRSVYHRRPDRTILEVRLEAGGAEPGTGDIVLFANHWKSRLPSREETEPRRLLSAAAVGFRISETHAGLFLVVGDLNTETPRLPGFAQPWDTSGYPGSYAYRGDWERLDHILYRAGETGAPGSPGAYRLDSFDVVAPPEALTAEGYPKRWIPRHGGVSDHLPVVARFQPPGAAR